VRFAAYEVIELMLQVDKPTLTKLADTVAEPFSKEELEELYMSIDDNIFERVSKRSSVDIFVDENGQTLEETFIEEAPEPKLGFFTKLGLALGIASELGSNEKKHNGRCNGDCADCPPHYGYRFGRWYYGHNHQHGCEFGGNKGL